MALPAEVCYWIQRGAHRRRNWVAGKGLNNTLEGVVLDGHSWAGGKISGPNRYKEKNKTLLIMGQNTNPWNLLVTPHIIKPLHLTRKTCKDKWP